MILILIRIVVLTGLFSIFFLLWRTYKQGKFAIKRMLEMEDARSRMVTDLTAFSEGLSALLVELRIASEVSAKKQAAIAVVLAKKVEATGTLLTQQITVIGEQITENTELTKQAIPEK